MVGGATTHHTTLIYRANYANVEKGSRSRAGTGATATGTSNTSGAGPLFVME